MAGSDQSGLAQRLLRLENHLAHENPVLLDVVRSFRRLDRVGYRLGALDPDESYATRVPWWPLIAVLGTFSSGKSTFINDFLKHKLQLTGNQAVDDKFTVICYSTDAIDRSLPGLALDADPRFPFYNISRDIESVAAGEGRRVDAYLQLKTCPSPALRGKILIDSPGFDADLQRTSTLRITDHIIDLSDLVLVFFDARHPEPGAMKDTLQHLVADTVKRPDSSKFLFILNQIDATAREDNPEEVFAAWQRALASAGLSAGRFYRIYNLEAANPIDDPSLRRRFEAKRAVDMAAVVERMQQVEVERAYRIIGVLEMSAKAIESELVPRLRAARQRWKRRVLWIDALIYGSVIGASVFAVIAAGGWQGLAAALPWPAPVLWAVVAMGGLLLLYPHVVVRRLAARSVLRTLTREPIASELREAVVKAFRKNTRLRHSLLRSAPIGWGRRTKGYIARVQADADRYVQSLNDRFASPSGPNDGAQADAGEMSVNQVEGQPERPALYAPSALDLSTIPQVIADEGSAEKNQSTFSGERRPGETPRAAVEHLPRRRAIHFEEPPPARRRD
ncbi:MAG: dynamin family protein [Pseudomonadota bacterium]|nr:dynamin family protein [Pseudomonadota bacterium]